MDGENIYNVLSLSPLGVGKGGVERRDTKPLSEALTASRLVSVMVGPCVSLVELELPGREREGERVFHVKHLFSVPWVELPGREGEGGVPSVSEP